MVCTLHLMVWKGGRGRLVWETLQLLSRISHCVEFHTPLMTWCHMQYVADTLIQSLIICTWKGQQICWLELNLRGRLLQCDFSLSLSERLLWSLELSIFTVDILKVKVTREVFINFVGLGRKCKMQDSETGRWTRSVLLQLIKKSTESKGPQAKKKKESKIGKHQEGNRCSDKGQGH